jgi:K+-sensing histidine kinase KdpD
MVAITRHDLKKPLTAICIATDMLLRGDLSVRKKPDYSSKSISPRTAPSA